MADNRPQRKELLPLARTQMKFVTIVCLPIVLACVVVTALQTYFFVTTLQPNMTAQPEFVAKVIPTAIWIAAITLLVLVPVFILIAIWVSHRIVGPMRRLEARLKEIGDGRIRGGFHFREGDELTFVADAVAGMERGLIERLEACGSASTEAEFRERLSAFELPAAADAQPAAPQPVGANQGRE